MIEGLIRFGVRNRVPVTLVMWALVLGGVWSALTMRREFFPEVDPDAAQVVLSYSGASPAEIEESLARKVEDAVREEDDVEKVTTSIVEGGGAVVIKFGDGIDIDEKLEDLRTRIDALQDLPPEADRLKVIDWKPILPVVQVAVYGNVDPRSIKTALRQVEDDLRAWRGMGRILVAGLRDDELRVEVRDDELVRHGIPITRVADAVGAWMREVPGGAVRSSDGEAAVRTRGVDERAQAMAGIVLKALPDGTSVTLGDVGTVVEGFTDDITGWRFQGEPGANLTILRAVGQDAVRMAEFTRGYVAARSGQAMEASPLERLLDSPRLQGWEAGLARGPMPDGVRIAKHNDLARLIEGRIDLVTENAWQGAVLVFLTLLLGVSVRGAFWVMNGMVVAIFGTILLMNLAGVTINMLTMFGLLIALGMLEDDAVVFTESIDDMARRGAEPERAAIEGTTRIFWPVFASILISIVAFVPLALVKGTIGDLLSDLPIVVALALAVSLLETSWMLPSHMAHSIALFRQGRRVWLDAVTAPFDRWRDGRLWPFLERRYRRLATWAVDHRWMTISVAIAGFIVSVGAVLGGRVPFEFLPSDDTESFIVDFRLPLGSSIERTRTIATRIESAVQRQPEVRAAVTLTGFTINYETGSANSINGNVGQVFVQLAPVEERERRSGEVADSIIAAVGSIPEIEDLRITQVTGGPAGADITYEFSSEDPSVLDAAVERMKLAMAGIEGIVSINDDNLSAAPEIQVELKPSAAALGFTPIDLAQQVRGAVYGLDAHVFTADREDVDVRVRLDEATRSTPTFTQDLWVVSPAGIPVPLAEVATVREGVGHAAIRRTDRMRTITVTGDVREGVIPEQVVEALAPSLAAIVRETPGLLVREGGRQKDLTDAFSTLPRAALTAFLLIYAILCWLFGSFVQPLAVMATIPFGVIGAVWGHAIMGYELTFLSLIGIVALSGVVVNNALVLVEFVNELRAKGMVLHDALIEAGTMRLRAILLTSITTVFGLAPLMLEQSFQARFLIPMAISLCFGLLSATMLTLLLLPAQLLVADSFGGWWRRVSGRSGLAGEGASVPG